MAYMRVRFPLLAAVWLTGLAVFVGMAIFAASNDTFPNDVWLAQRIQDVDSGALANLLDWAEDLGDLPLIAVVCAASAIALVLAGDAFGAALVVLTATGRALNNWAIKVIVERPRPSADLVDFNDQPSSFSFPSGHSESAMVLYGLLFYFSSVHISNLWMKRAAQVLCVVLIAGNGIERIYVGHHWPSDVLGGFLLGALILSAAIAVHQLAPRVGLTVTSGRPLRFHVRRNIPEQGLAQPRDT
jgi:membrane-associated phospholipid phosphatase